MEIGIFHNTISSVQSLQRCPVPQYQGKCLEIGLICIFSIFLSLVILVLIIFNLLFGTLRLKVIPSKNLRRSHRLKNGLSQNRYFIFDVCGWFTELSARNLLLTFLRPFQHLLLFERVELGYVVPFDCLPCTARSWCGVLKKIVENDGKLTDSLKFASCQVISDI